VIEADQLDPSALDAANGAIAGHARTMIVGTALSRLTGFLRIAALSYALGLNRLSDAYNLANTTPNILYDLVVGGVLSATVVPIFVRAVRTHDRAEQDWDAISAVFTVVGVVLGVLTLLFAIAVPVIVRLYTVGLHDPASLAERRLAVDLLYFFVPQLALYGMVSLVQATLNARRRFAAPAFAPILNNLVVIAVVLSVPRLVGHRHPTVDQVLHSSAARIVLGIGTTAGVLLMAVAMVPSLAAAGARLHWHWHPRHPAVRTLLRLAGWTAGFVVANQLAFFIVTLLANRHSGGFTAYSYAYVLFLLPHGIFAVSVMSAAEPELAASWHDGDLARYRQQFLDGIKLVAAIIVPAALGYGVLARPVVRLLLQHGSYGPGAAKTTADVLAIMALGLPAFSVYLYLMRAFQAMQDTRTMFLVYLVENGVNVILAFALYPTFGVQGLAAALALAYAVGCVVALRIFRDRLGGLAGRRIGTILYRIAVAGVVTADVALGASVLLAHLLGTSGGATLLVRVLAAVAVGVTVYLRVARYFGVDEVRSLLQLRRRTAS
jgi:putative peptidoglycan lipid II flippase